MSILYLKVIDEDGEEVELENLTDIGRGMVTSDAKQLISDLEDINRKEED